MIHYIIYIYILIYNIIMKSCERLKSQPALLVEP